MTSERLFELPADAELAAEVERLQAQIAAVQQLLADLKKASDLQYSRSLVILRLKQALGENQ